MNNILITGSTSYLGEYVVKNHTNKKFFFSNIKILKDVEVINDNIRVKWIEYRYFVALCKL